MLCENKYCFRLGGVFDNMLLWQCSPRQAMRTVSIVSRPVSVFPQERVNVSISMRLVFAQGCA